MQKKCILSFVETCTVGKNLNFLTAVLDTFWVISVYCDREFYFSLDPKNATFKSNWSSNLCINLLNPTWITKNKASHRKTAKKFPAVLVCFSNNHVLAVAYVFFLGHISWGKLPHYHYEEGSSRKKRPNWPKEIKEEEYKTLAILLLSCANGLCTHTTFQML